MRSKFVIYNMTGINLTGLNSRVRHRPGLQPDEIIAFYTDGLKLVGAGDVYYEFNPYTGSDSLGVCPLKNFMTVPDSWKVVHTTSAQVYKAPRFIYVVETIEFDFLWLGTKIEGVSIVFHLGDEARKDDKISVRSSVLFFDKLD